MVATLPPHYPFTSAPDVPQISVVVPVLNETANLPSLFRTLAEQAGLALELILSDGGSTDGTPAHARMLAHNMRFPVTVITGEPGRGKQFNAGVAVSRGPTLLFLHADSRFTDPHALSAAVRLLAETTARKGTERIAGRFILRFDRQDASPSLPFSFYENKARLNRKECVHGDQGIMVRRAFFSEAGPFDVSLPMLAETRFAEKVRAKGEWLLFPAEIFTSARRFETEGMYARQLLNAIIMNFAAQGWETFFRELPTIYDAHNRSRPIPLPATLRSIKRLIALLPLHQRLSLWYASGAYVRSNAWQIPFFFDVRRNMRRGIPARADHYPFLEFHDRYMERLTDNLPGRLAAASLTWLWFHLTFLHASLKDGTGRKPLNK